MPNNNTQQHTKEPWIDVPWDYDTSNVVLLGDEGKSDTIIIRQVSHANARRIVACVNACAGIPTEALEEGVVEEMVAGLNSFIFSLLDDSETDLEIRMEAIMPTIEAVIHKAKGEVKKDDTTFCP